MEDSERTGRQLVRYFYALRATESGTSQRRELIQQITVIATEYFDWALVLKEVPELRDTSLHKMSVLATDRGQIVTLLERLFHNLSDPEGKEWFYSPIRGSIPLEQEVQQILADEQTYSDTIRTTIGAIHRCWSKLEALSSSEDLRSTWSYFGMWGWSPWNKLARENASTLGQTFFAQKEVDRVLLTEQNRLRPGRKAKARV